MNANYPYGEELINRKHNLMFLINDFIPYCNAIGNVHIMYIGNLP